MKKIQIQIPDELHAKLTHLAQRKNLSLAEIFRCIAEYMVRVYPQAQEGSVKKWSPPHPRPMGKFHAGFKNWRELSNSCEE